MIVACVKWTALRVEVDPLTGVVSAHDRDFGLSPADQAALEWALRLGTAMREPVSVITAGGPASDSGLREAVALGALHPTRVELTPDAPSADVARALAAQLADARLVLCGAYSADRGSGSVPSFLAGELGIAQALGVISLVAGSPLEVTRRLDAGRRERLLLHDRAVVSVEGATARLRRAATAAVIAAKTTAITVHRSSSRPNSSDADHPVLTGPFVPPPRVLPAPAGTTRDRILALTGALSQERSSRQVLDVAPPVAAQAILDQLRAWGYLE